MASKSVTVTTGTPGADDDGLGFRMAPAGGINAAGLSSDVMATGLVSVTTGGNLELMGRTVAGATIVETPDGSTFDWSGASRRTTDVILSADGKTFIGGNTVNIDGESRHSKYRWDR